ncbi:MAG: glycosyltransferase [Candidatus Competibacteraceae bacterium]|nr:glycosyltransferase [Candidatus Competibacteraceae bacterium]
MNKMKISGSLDSYNNGFVEGWVYNQSFPNAHLEVAIFIDGAEAASGTAAKYRADLDAAKIGGGDHAFQILLPDYLCDDEMHSVDVKIIGTGISLPNCPRKISLSHIRPSYNGFVELVSASVILGWAWDEVRPDSHVDVEIFVDRQYLATVPANLFRRDLADARMGDGTKAFNYAVPPDICIKEFNDVICKIKGSDFQLPLLRPESWPPLPVPPHAKPATPTQIGVRQKVGRNASAKLKTSTSSGAERALKQGAERLERNASAKAEAANSCVETLPDISMSSEISTATRTSKILNKTPAETAIPIKGFEGYIFGVKYPHVKGWAWNKNFPSEPVSVDLFIGGRKILTQHANQFRKDIFEAGKGDGHKAFSFRIPDGVVGPGEHDLKVVVSSTDYSLKNCPPKIFIPSSRHPIAKRDVLVEGRLERADHRGISGWAWDRSSPNEPISVEILVESEVLDVCLAATYRQDLEKAGKGNGAHAFRLPTPPYLCDGNPHKINVRVTGTEHFLNKEPLIFIHDATRPFNSYEEFYDWAMLNREIYEPIKENDRRVFGYMAWYRDTLIGRYENSTSAPLVSVIMPAFNRADVIGESIISVIEQRYPNWELIVVDDGSVDDTPRVVRAFKNERIKLVELGKNRGVSAARNAGMAIAKGDYFAYLDSDNTWDDHFLLIMVNSLSEKAEFDAAYCGQIATEIHKSSLHGDREVRFTRFGPFNQSLIENRNYIDLNCYVHRRSLYVMFGGFDEEMRRLVDWELIMRYARNKFPLAVPVILSNYFYGRATNQITSLERISHAEEILDKRIKSNAFRVTDLPTINQYDDYPTYEFFTSICKYRSEQHDRFVSIVVVSYEAAQFLDYCLASVVKFTSSDKYELIVIDNASSREVVDLLGKWEKAIPNFRVIYNDSNAGFTFAVNQGIEIARPGSDIVLLNNDAIVTEGWIAALQAVLKTESDVGLVIPRQTLLPQTPTMEDHVPSSNTRRELDVNLSVHHNNILNTRTDPLRGYVELKFAPFFCAYITRECFNRAGLLNARDGRHYRSDRLYCDVVREYANMRIIYTPHSKLYHFLQQSTKELKNTRGEEYKKIFIDNTWDDAERKKYGLQK